MPFASESGKVNRKGSMSPGQCCPAGIFVPWSHHLCVEPTLVPEAAPQSLPHLRTQPNTQSPHNTHLFATGLTAIKAAVQTHHHGGPPQLGVVRRCSRWTRSPHGDPFVKRVFTNSYTATTLFDNPLKKSYAFYKDNIRRLVLCRFEYSWFQTGFLDLYTAYFVVFRYFSCHLTTL